MGFLLSKGLLHGGGNPGMSGGDVLLHVNDTGGGSSRHLAVAPGAASNPTLVNITLEEPGGDVASRLKGASPVFSTSSSQQVLQV